MKILHIASGDLWAGAEVQLYHLTRALTAIPEIELVIALLNEGQLANELRSTGVAVVIIDESKLSSLSVFIHLFKLALRFKPDVIHTHRSKENIIGGLAAFMTNTSSVRTTHGANELSDNGFSLRRSVITLFDRISGRFFQDRIIAVSTELAGKLKALYPGRKLTVIHNGIDIEEVIRQSNMPVDFKCHDEHFNIGFVGRFVPVKRTDIFINIAVHVISQCHDRNIHFHMFGDGPLWEEANRKIIEHKCQAQIHTRGFVNNTAPYLKAMDMLIFTSDHEGLPMTLLEAMALNVAVLSRELTTIKQVLCHGECGYIPASDTVEGFSELIIHTYNKKEDLTKKTAMAFENLQAHYSIQQIAERYVALYREVTS